MGGEVVFHFFGCGCGYCYTIGLRDALHLKNTHPDKICRRCKRKIDAIDKKFRNSIKHPTLPYNFTEDKKSLAKFEESSPVCHHVWSCTVCGKHSKETHTQQTHNDDNHEDNIEVTFRDENPRLKPQHCQSNKVEFQQQ